MGLIHFKNESIDRKAWLKAHSLSQEALYSHPTFLDYFSPGWEALIEADKLYMPLPVKSFFGIKYLVQPAFCQQLGPFGPSIRDEKKVKSLLETIAHKYPRINIYLNQNAAISSSDKLKLIWRNNFCLELDKEYSTLKNSYSTNLKRNLKKALKSKLEIVEIQIRTAFDYYIDNTLNQKKISVIKDKHKAMLLKFLQSEDGVNFTAEAVRSNEKIVSIVVWAQLYKRTYYFLSSSNKEGKALGAAPLLIDNFLQHEAGGNAKLDFEGSMIPGLARFYNGFGANSHKYAHISKRVGRR